MSLLRNITSNLTSSILQPIIPSDALLNNQGFKLDFSDLDSLTIQGGGPPINNAQASGAEDLTLSGSDAIQAVSARQGLLKIDFFKAGKAGIFFDRSDDFYDLAKNTTSDLAEYTMVTVEQLASGGGSGQIVIGKGDTSDPNKGLFINYDDVFGDALEANAGTPGGAVFGVVEYVPSTYVTRITIFTQSNTLSVRYIDGVAEGTHTQASPTPLPQLRIGALGNGFGAGFNLYGGVIGYVEMIPRVLSNSEIITLSATLAAEWT